MYNILIVDDEKKEREGIALLLKKVWVSIKNSICAKWRRCAENNGKKSF